MGPTCAQKKVGILLHPLLESRFIDSVDKGFQKRVGFGWRLGHGVMVTQQILVLLFRVRVLVTQQKRATLHGVALFVLVHF